MILIGLYVIPLLTLLFISILANRYKQTSRQDALLVILISFIPVVNVALLIAMFVIFCSMCVYELLNNNVIKEYWESFVKWVLPHE